MAGLTNSHWSQWDTQESKRIRLEREARQFAELNNTYLAIERGDEVLTITNANRLRVLVGQLWDTTDNMQDWWLSELQALPNWENV